jgi:UDP-glucose:(heptosyl)LPS alpha-1,3-glucosyltransferase
VRIALVAPQVRATGGQDRYALELARRLLARHEVHVLAAAIEGLDGSAAIQHPFPIRTRPALWFAEPFARRTLLTATGAGFDVTHAVGGCMPGASVITAPYCHAAWRDAQARYRVGEGSWPLRVYQSAVTEQSERYERDAYAHPDLRAVIAVSSRVATDLEQHYGVPGARITVIPNGVDVAQFDRTRYPDARSRLRAELGLGPDVPLALIVGAAARKGLETAIRAVARASAVLHLVVVGSGDARAAQRWARAAGLGDRLHWLGPRADVPVLYAAADLFLLPTRYEPYGMVVTEAMASGLPVVVSAVAGAADHIVPGENGWVVREPDDVDAFAAAIRSILADPAAAAEAGRRARAVTLDLGWVRIAERTEEVYRRAAA